MKRLILLLTINLLLVGCHPGRTHIDIAPINNIDTSAYDYHFASDVTGYQISLNVYENDELLATSSLNYSIKDKSPISTMVVSYKNLLELVDQQNVLMAPIDIFSMLHELYGMTTFNNPIKWFDQDTALLNNFNFSNMVSDDIDEAFSLSFISSFENRDNKCATLTLHLLREEQHAKQSVEGQDVVYSSLNDLVGEAVKIIALECKDITRISTFFDDSQETSALEYRIYSHKEEVMPVIMDLVNPSVGEQCKVTFTNRLFSSPNTMSVMSINHEARTIIFKHASNQKLMTYNDWIILPFDQLQYDLMGLPVDDLTLGETYSIIPTFTAQGDFYGIIIHPYKD